MRWRCETEVGSMSLSCFEEVEVERLRKKSDGGGHRFVEVSENVGPVFFAFSLPIFSPSALSAEDRARYPLEDAVAASLSLSLSKANSPGLFSA